MTCATVYFNSDKTVSRVMVKGHSGYADSGFDIVCSAISTSMILTANLITKLSCKENYIINIDEKTNIIDIMIKEFDTERVLEKVMDNLFESLRSISSDYPKYFKIILAK